MCEDSQEERGNTKGMTRAAGSTAPRMRRCPPPRDSRGTADRPEGGTRLPAGVRAAAAQGGLGGHSAETAGLHLEEIV